MPGRQKVIVAFALLWPNIANATATAGRAILGAFWVVLARLAMASLGGGAAGSPARACLPARAQAASPGDPSLIAIARPSRTVRSLGEVASLVVEQDPDQGHADADEPARGIRDELRYTGFTPQ